MNYVDIVIIGSGMSGLYSAYKIKLMKNLISKYQKTF